MGISKSRWCGSGKFILSTGETIVYSGRDDEVHQHGVAIMLNKDVAKALINWAPIDERIIRARFHSKYVKLTLIHVCAPINDTDEEVKDHFYEKLQTKVKKTPKHDLLVITGDLNAKVGSDVEGYERVMGLHGVGTRNDNCERLCDFCGMNDLVITGTIFPYKKIHKQTWISLDRRTCNQIDHLLMSNKFRTSVLDTRAIRSADNASDHRLVCTKLRLKLKAAPKRRGIRRTGYDTKKLQNDGCRRQFRLELRNRFEILQREEPKDDETAQPEAELGKANGILEKAYNMTAKKVLGYKTRKLKPWISKESWDLIEQRKGIKLKLDGTNSERLNEKRGVEYNAKDREVKRQIRTDKRNWSEGITREAEEAANMQHMKTLTAQLKRSATIKQGRTQ
ncbi:craniofacial development protein 2-like [Montipora foliosa]|uniref:craniofacial development protein 2-like n=1 Tax=Montipora foliosa TaxID=591990 RepID=UPI0035F12AE3